MIMKVYKYLFYCYYLLVDRNSDCRIDGAHNLLTYFVVGTAVPLYYGLCIISGRKNFNPTIEGLGVFLFGALIWYFNSLYFVKWGNGQAARKSFETSSNATSKFLGVILLFLPFALFVFAGIKMGSYIRSLK